MNNNLKYPDTNSARAKIADLNEKFFGLKIGIIGLGGTGSYILDHVAKTPVDEIHLIDGDDFELHNGFRMPGAINGDFLDKNPGLKKVDYHKMKYSEVHNGINVHDMYINEGNSHFLKDFDFVFICVDKNKARSIIIKALQIYGVPFIDTGIDIQRIGNQLDAAIRVTTGSNEKNDHLSERIGTGEREENEYHSNIQISEINSLCASFAVIKWKKNIQYYLDLKQEHNTLWFSSTNKIINEDNQTPNLNEKNSAA